MVIVHKRVHPRPLKSQQAVEHDYHPRRFYQPSLSIPVAHLEVSFVRSSTSYKVDHVVCDTCWKASFTQRSVWHLVIFMSVITSFVFIAGIVFCDIICHSFYFSVYSLDEQLGCLFWAIMLYIFLYFPTHISILLLFISSWRSKFPPETSKNIFVFILGRYFSLCGILDLLFFFLSILERHYYTVFWFLCFWWETSNHLIIVS